MMKKIEDDEKIVSKLEYVFVWSSGKGAKVSMHN